MKRHTGPDRGTVLGGASDLRYFGPLSTVSSLFTETLDTKNKTPDELVSHQIKASLEQGTYSQWAHPGLNKVFARRVNGSLPPWDKALDLVSDFFREENSIWPLFDPPTFMTFLGRQYTDDPPDEPAWWACFNIVLAISERRRLERECATSDSWDAAWRYASNAMDVTLDVMMRNISLLSVQALIGIAWFYLGTPNPQPPFMLSAAAVRLGHATGLHRQDCGSTCRSAEKKQRGRVFWLAKMLDQHVCLRTGRPPAQDPDDFSVGLPIAGEGENLGISTTTDGQTTLNVFLCNVQLSLVEADVYTRLYSATAEGTEITNLQGIMTDLDEKLERWKETLPVEVRPDHVISGWNAATQLWT
ncbi:hypothetical protein ACJ41O_006520 [Fusarium nematophilum]